jgi:hypothetical protein
MIIRHVFLSTAVRTLTPGDHVRALAVSLP